ncbi:MAG TPA: sigma-70 family RNA polymerase sigma factor [Thermoanaerobaculia bacterium]|nr:sigma-70 family RNA polymerase sigma factor [Thermoanaerobaculia bacterium]
MATGVEESAPPAVEEDEDRAVLERVADGDAEAFALLVERHQERLVRVCTRMLGDREEARDAAQEAFLKAFRGAADYRPRGKVYTWLYRIAVNHCLNKLRRRRIVRFLSLSGPAEGTGGDEAPAFDPATDAPGPDDALESRQRWQRARRAIAGLPPNQRAVLVLARFEGLAYKEIAEVLGITLGAVESRLVRAMRNLSAAMEDDAAKENGA